MHRYTLLQMLDRYLDRFPNEAEVVARVAGLVEQYADCFHRACRPGHITGSAWVVSADHRHVALVHHRKLDRWLQPGGHADGDGDVAEVARREAAEETGLTNLTLVTGEPTLLPLDIDVHDIPARHDGDGNLMEDAHEHHDVRFLFIASEQESTRAALAVSHESHAVGWFDEPAIRSMTDEPSLLRMLDKAIHWLR